MLDFLFSRPIKITLDSNFEKIWYMELVYLGLSPKNQLVDTSFEKTMSQHTAFFTLAAPQYTEQCKGNGLAGCKLYYLIGETAKLQLQED